MWRYSISQSGNKVWNPWAKPEGTKIIFIFFESKIREYDLPNVLDSSLRSTMTSKILPFIHLINLFSWLGDDWKCKPLTVPAILEYEELICTILVSLNNFDKDFWQLDFGRFINTGDFFRGFSY